MAAVRARPSWRARTLTLVGVLSLLVVACGSDEPASEATSAAAPATEVGTVPGTVATIPPATEAPTTTAAPTIVAPTTVAKPAPTPPAAAPAATPRGLPVASTTVTLVDSSRPTVSKGRTIAGTRTMTTLVTYPASGGPYPLVVFAHGFQLGPGSYRRIIDVIAAAGYVVAAPSFPLADAAVAGGNLDRGDIPNQSDDLSFVIDQVTTGALAGRIDRARIGAVGHSDGADTVLDLGYTAAHVDGRVRAVAALSPDAMPSGASAGSAPLLIIHGDRDSIVPYSNATTVFGQVGVHRFLVTLAGADHLPPVQGAAPWAVVVDRTVLDLLDHHVAGRTGSDEPLVADASVTGVASVRRGS